MIIYGMMDASRVANPAHARYRPLPIVTSTPKDTGDPVCPTVISFTDWAFLMMTVHIVAPMRSMKLPRMAKNVDSKNAKVCLATPLHARALV